MDALEIQKQYHEIAKNATGEEILESFEACITGLRTGDTSQNWEDLLAEISTIYIHKIGLTRMGSEKMMIGIKHSIDGMKLFDKLKN